MVFLLMVPTKINRQSQIVCDWGSRERLNHLACLHVTCVTVISPSKQVDSSMSSVLGPDVGCLPHVWCRWGHLHEPDITSAEASSREPCGHWLAAFPGLTLNSIIEGEEKTESS